MSHLITPTELAPARRDLPGGDWLAVELMAGQLPAFGQPVHERFALVLVLAGEGTYHDHAGHGYDLRPGCAFQHVPGVRHRVQRHRPGAWRQLVLRTSAGAWQALMTFLDPIEAMVWTPGPGAVPAMLSLHRALARPDMPYWAVLSCTAETLAHLAPKAADPWSAAADALAADRQRRIALPALADSLGMSYSSFRRGFRLRHGLAPAAWRRRARLDEATRLIAGGMPDPQAARCTGWSGSGALAKARSRRPI